MALGFLVPIIVLPLIQSYSGDVTFNELMIGVSYAAFIFVLLDYGQSTYLVVQNSDVKFKDVIVVRSVLFILITSLWLLLKTDSNQFTQGLFIIGLGNVINTQWLWHKHEKFVSFSIVSNVNKIAIILMLLISFVIKNYSLFYLFSICHFSINLVFTIVAFFHSDFDKYFIDEKLNINFQYLLDGLLFYVSRVSASYYNMLLIPIASLVLPTGSLATFIVAERFYQLALASVQPILNMLNTSLRREFQIIKWFKWFFAAIIAIIIALYVLNIYGENILELLGYSVDVNLFHQFVRWFSVAAILSLISMFSGHPILSTNGLHRVSNLSVIISVVIFILLTRNMETIDSLFIALCVTFGFDALIRVIFVTKMIRKWS